MSKATFPSHLFDEKGKILFDNLPMPSYAWQIVNNDLILINYNYAAHEITKGTIENFVGIQASELYKDQPEILEDLKRCAKEKSNFFKEMKYQFQIVDDEKYLSVNYGFIPPDILVVHTNDITDKIHAELKRMEMEKKLKESEKILKTLNQKLEQEVRKRTKKIKESEQKYRLITENANDLIGIVNQKFEYEFINEKALSNMLGYKSEEVIGKKTLDFIHPEDIQKIIKKSYEGFRTGKAVGDIRTKHKNGHYIWLELKGKTFIDGEGKLKAIIVSRNITDRKKAELKLKESEEKYRLISENVKDIIGVINDQYEIEYVNEEALMKMSGYSADEIGGKSSLTFVHPDDVKKTIKSFNLGLKEGYAVEELRLMIKNGGYLWIEATGSVFLDSNGKEKGAVVLRDITERKEMENKLKQSEKKYRHLFESSPFMIALINADGKIADFNPMTLNYVPYEKIDLIGKDFRDLDFIFLNNLDKLKEMYKELLIEGFTKPIEFDFREKGTPVEWINLQASQVEIDQEKLIQVIIQDITAKKTAELKLKESEEKYRLISENVNDIITVQDGNFNIEYVNEHALKKMLGYSKSELLGKQAIKFAHPDDKERILNEFLKLFKEGEASVEGRLLHKNGHSLWADFNGKLAFDEKRKPKFLLITRDITERKKAEKKLKTSEKKYREAYKRASFYKDLFIHDINNIMQVVNSSAELIFFQIEAVEKTIDIGSITDMIKKQVLRAKRLVQSVTILSELEERKNPIQSTELCVTLENSIKYLKITYQERDIAIKFETFKKRIFVEANELLQEIFDNILINAVKYNDKNSIEIFIKIDKERIEDNNYIKIEFIDNGMGVKDDRKKLIFKRGFREFKGEKGMGLGLSLVKKIVKNYNGKIWVEDKVTGEHSQGSKFIVLIPQSN